MAAVYPFVVHYEQFPGWPHTDRRARHHPRVLAAAPREYLIETWEGNYHRPIKLVEAGKTYVRRLDQSRVMKLVSQGQMERLRNLARETCGSSDCVYRLPCRTIYGATIPIDFDEEMSVLPSKYNFRSCQIIEFHVGKLTPYRDHGEWQGTKERFKAPLFPSLCSLEPAEAHKLRRTYPGLAIDFPRSGLLIDWSSMVSSSQAFPSLPRYRVGDRIGHWDDAAKVFHEIPPPEWTLRDDWDEYELDASPKLWLENFGRDPADDPWSRASRESQWSQWQRSAHRVAQPARVSEQPPVPPPAHEQPVPRPPPPKASEQPVPRPPLEPVSKRRAPMPPPAVPRQSAS